MHWLVAPTAGLIAFSSLCFPGRALAQTDISASSPALTWTAQWIGRNNPPSVPKLGQQAPTPLLRKEFTVANPVAKATLSICGLGFYEAFINGQRIGDQVLDPPPTAYNETALYATFDITELLYPGTNAIGVTLGRGYFGATADDGFNLGNAPWRNEPRLILQLDITYGNGQTARVISDGSWQMADGPALDSLTFGELYDARLEQPGWTLAGFNASSWTTAPVQPSPTKKLLPRAMPPIAIVDTLAPVAVSTPQPGITVYDFGRITAGWERIFTRGQRGTKITFVLGETLNADGTVYQLAPQEHLDSYTLSGSGNETWEPQFMRHGFRYIQVSYSPAAPSSFQIEARINHTNVASTGDFVCSNDLLNQIHQIQRTAVLNNLWGFPTDTPWRDRQGWTADAHLYMTSAIENFGMQPFYDQWLRTFRESQQPDGGLPVIAPFGNSFPLFTDPSWSGTLIFDTWQMYQDYGDLQLVKDNYSAMTSWMNLMAATISSTGNVYKGFTFSDWAAPGTELNGGLLLPPEAGTINNEVPVVTGSGELYLEARQLAEMAKILGHSADAATYNALANQIATALNGAFFDSTANVYHTSVNVGYRQTSNLIPLAYGLVPSGHEKAVYANLIADIKSHSDHLNTGSIGTKQILPVLTEHGDVDLAYTIATQTTYPSWGYWLTQGANTSWETWSHLSGVQSLDHSFLGTAEDWLFEYIAGIQPAAPGYAKVHIRPFIPTGLSFASASITTPRGVVSSSWSIGHNGVRLDVGIPDNTPADVYVPVSTAGVHVATGQAKLLREENGYRVYQIEAGKAGHVVFEP